MNSILTNSPQAIPSGPTTLPDDDPLYARVAWRLMPLLLLGYIIAYIDRVNVGFAKLQMMDALKFSEAAFGLGAGIMFIGYFLFEVPSNILLERIGARKTLLRIMVLWGLTTMGMTFVSTPTHFYVLRFFLGVFEAGFFPGVILYLTYWFPAPRRGRLIGIFMSGTIVAGIISGPVSGATMKFLDGVNGWQGWQWLFITQGAPAVLLGIVTYFWLDDSPKDARWLTSNERDRLAFNLGSNAKVTHGETWSRFRELLADRTVWALGFADFLLIGASYTMVFWTPSLIRSWGVSDLFQIGLYSAVPNIFGVIAMILMTRSSDLRMERRWHFFAAVVTGTIGLAITTQTQGQLIPSMIGLCIASVGLASAIPLLIAAATDYLPGRLAAAGIPMITSIAILGGAVSPAVTGLIKTITGQEAYSMYLVMAVLLVSGAVMLVTLRPLGAKSAF